MLAAAVSANASEAPVGRLSLDGTWQMKDFTLGVGEARQVYLPGKRPEGTLPCRVPGTVRTALLEAGEIPDPYVGYDNEKSLWVEAKEWWFFKTFPVDATLEGRFVDLDFAGTSFQGAVWLNGEKVGELLGMLNPRSFDVTRALRYGQENTLVVRLQATPDARMNLTARGLTWDTPRDQLYSIAQCMYGWDWGPHGVPIGIWQSVSLRVSGPLRLESPYVRSTIDSPRQATLHVALDVVNASKTPRQGVLAGEVVEKTSGRTAAKLRQSVELGPQERRTFRFDVEVPEPKLWWPNGMGAQDLYLLSATLTEGAAGAPPSESLKTQFGIRELKLVENEKIDEFVKAMKEHTGSVYHLGRAVGSYPWTFEVNGQKMFAKGANWIPPDLLLRLDRGRYQRQLSLARDAHMNLLRVWGGGLYETDEFYDLCDEYGLLTWQEFLSNRSFSKIDRESFLEGARAAILRLRNRPSLTFWCGGNEFDPDDTGSKAVIDALGALLSDLDPAREFHRASPYMGDDHYWGVWHGREPYTKYRVVRPFRSEAGMNTFPVAESYRRFTPPDLLWPPDQTFVEYHGENNTRFQHLQKLMRYADEFAPATSIGDLIRKSQLYQALANSFDMEFCRANKFRNSGLLIWQYDDIWPAISWSLVDWYGAPKPSYYFQKRASRPRHVSADYERYLWRAGETFAATIHLLNDDALTPLSEAVWRARILDVSGHTLADVRGTATVPAGGAAPVGRIELPLSEDLRGRSLFVAVELRAGDGARLSEALYPIAVSASSKLDDYGHIFADLDRLPPAELQLEPGSGVTVDAAGVRRASVRLSNPTGGLAYFVRARLADEARELRASYSDNYLALLPGESKTIEVSVEAPSAGGPQAASSPWRLVVSGWNVPESVVELGSAPTF